MFQSHDVSWSWTPIRWVHIPISNQSNRVRILSSTNFETGSSTNTYIYIYYLFNLTRLISSIPIFPFFFTITRDLIFAPPGLARDDLHQRPCLCREQARGGRDPSQWLYLQGRALVKVTWPGDLVYKKRMEASACFMGSSTKLWNLIGKSPCVMAKSRISMAISSNKHLVYQKVT